MNRHAVNPQILGRCATRTSLYNYYLRVEKFIPYHAQLQLPCETGSVRAAACAALSHPSPKELWRARGAACPTRHVSGQRELARTTSRPPESERTESHSGSPHVAARPMTATSKPSAISHTGSVKFLGLINLRQQQLTSTAHCGMRGSAAPRAR